MAKRNIRITIDGKISILSIILSLFCSLSCLTTLKSQQLTQAEFSKEIENAYSQGNEALAVSLIKDHRLFVKPFVNNFITEGIIQESGGKTGKSRQTYSIVEKAAKDFEQLFGEKSLSIGIEYLKIWSKRQKRNKLTADSLYVLGTSIRGDPQQREAAIGDYLQALDLYKEIGDERGEAEVLGGMGLIYSSIDIHKSLQYYEDALKKREDVDDRQLVGNTLNSLGFVYLKLSNFSKAIYFYDKAEKLRREIGDSVNLIKTKTSKAEVYLKQGELLKDTGKYPESLESLERALALHKTLDNTQGISQDLNQIGFVYFKLGESDSAVVKCNEALELSMADSDTSGMAGIYNNLGVIYQNAQRIGKAIGFYNKALSLYEKSGDQVNSLVLLNNLGTISFDLKDFYKAAEFHLRGLKISRQLNEKDQEAGFLLNLANDRILLGNLDEAMANYTEAFEIAGLLNNPDLSWRIITGMAEIWERKGNCEKAAALNDSALAIIESLRNTLVNDEQRASFMASERYVFEDIIGLLATLHEKDNSKGYDKLAFSYAEQSKARVFLDLISNPSGGDIGKPISITEAQELLPDDNTVMLEYSIGDSSSCLWVITKSSFRLFIIPDRISLQGQIESLRFALSDPRQTNSEFFIASGNNLYQTLLKPAEPFFTKRSKLVIIPDGILNYIPFEVLLSENNKAGSETSYSSLPFLIKKYPVSYCQSASIIKNLFSEHPVNIIDKHNALLVAFGDPDYETLSVSGPATRNSYKRLEYSGMEVENIASFFKKGNADIFLRDDANEGNVKKVGELKKGNYLHFATHGYIDELKPELSSLVLTQNNDPEEDGFLNANEIFKLDINADLVVLSACQTGLGKLVRGEGMVGLTRAFMYAGTPTVLVSLWSVSDVSTATLMGEFYRNLIKKKLSKTEALRDAQLTLLGSKQFAHPFYWAPFVMIGDWR